MTGNIHQYENVIKKLKDVNSSIVGISSQEYIQKQGSNSHIFHVVDTTTVIYYFFENSIAISKLEKFRTLISKSIEKKYTKIHLYFPDSPSNSIMKEIVALNFSKTVEIRVQSLKHYNIELHNGPHCSIHEIMTPDEIEKEITRTLKVSIYSLPSIPLNDAQLQMINVKKGDVVRITNNRCRITGSYISYRVVTSPLEKNEAIDKSEKKEESDIEETNDFSESDNDESSDDMTENTGDSDAFDSISESESDAESD